MRAHSKFATISSLRKSTTPLRYLDLPALRELQLSHLLTYLPIGKPGTSSFFDSDSMFEFSSLAPWLLGIPVTGRHVFLMEITFGYSFRTIWSVWIMCYSPERICSALGRLAVEGGSSDLLSLVSAHARRWWFCCSSPTWISGVCGDDQTD